MSRGRWLPGERSVARGRWLPGEGSGSRGRWLSRGRDGRGVRRPQGRAAGHRSSPGRWAERGSFSLELAVLAPALLVLIAFIISVGRVTEGRALVQGAARDAARAATINHNGGPSARQAAQAAFASATAGMNCQPLQLTPAVIVPDVQVVATVTCDVTTMWGRQTVSRTATSATDRYRGTD